VELSGRSALPLKHWKTKEVYFGVETVMLALCTKFCKGLAAIAASPESHKTHGASKSSTILVSNDK
jgi:hypothetical protein